VTFRRPFDGAACGREMRAAAPRISATDDTQDPELGGGVEGIIGELVRGARPEDQRADQQQEHGTSTAMNPGRRRRPIDGLHGGYTNRKSRQAQGERATRSLRCHRRTRPPGEQ
jgi:hypothetical protein